MNWQEAERGYDDEVLGMTPIPRMFEDAAERHAKRPAQQYKGGVYDRSFADSVLSAAPDGEYRAISYSAMRDIVRNLAAGFRDLGVESDDRVAIFADTRMEWAQTDFALLAAGAVVTTVYTSSSESQVEYLLSDPEAVGVVAENRDLAERVIAVEDDLDHLEFVVVMDDLAPATAAEDAAPDVAEGDDVHTLAEVHDRGATLFDPDEYDYWIEDRDVDDLASLIYTSGTTGQPKGVRLSHRNFRANVNQVRRRYGPRPDKGDTPVIDADSRTVSFLPLAHVFERTSGHFVMFASGATVAYAESPDTLREDFQGVRPTTATSVPRVYEKIYAAIREEAQSTDLRQRIFEWAIDVGQRYTEADSPGIALRTQRAVADRLVFSQVTEALGGEIDFLISGGGSLSSDLCALYHAMGLPILEGYGLTETAPVVSVNPPEDPEIGTIGPPVVDVEVEVDEAVVDQSAFEDDPGDVGELLVRGPNVSDGYWNRPGATRRVFDDEGWFRTGDVVHIRPDGYLEFRERAKQILVLSTGKNVAPGPIEDAFAASDVVEQCMVVGDGEKFVGGIVVPSMDGMQDWADREGIELPEDEAAFLNDDRVQERIAEEVDRINENFEPHERIKDFRLVSEEFTESNDLMTPTMKKKRRNIRKYFADEIEDIYAAAEA
ncbi:MAG: long-chain acyl-CoA synthetase [Natronomonas sp.]|jgi:long-chain acyl-CoA synthetase